MSTLKKTNPIKYTFPDGTSQRFALTYQVFGQPLHQAPIIVVNHALTGNSEVSGQKGWWNKLIGAHQVIDLNKFTVIAFNIPGNGYQIHNGLIKTYKKFSTQIIADLFWRGLESLGIKQLYAIIGCSLGGGISWEMAFLKPQAIQHLIPIATNLKASDWLIGNVYLQDRILSHSKNPIEYARIHAMLLYRTPGAFQMKFNNNYNTSKDEYDVEIWLKYHGTALQNRFSLEAYKLSNHLLKTIGKGRQEEDIIKFAQTNTAQIHSIAIDSDYLFTKEEQEHTYQLIKTHNTSISFNEIHSVHGHDAFLIEYEQLNQLLKPIF